MTDLREAEIARQPIGSRLEKRILCPECGQHLPVTGWTECDRCGAHLSLKWDVEAPSQ